MAEKFDRSVSLVCWAYNEEELIEEFLQKATELLDMNISDYEIVIVDDASTDKTNSLIKDFQKRNPKIRLIRNEKNLNVGLSSKKAIGAASKDYLFWQTIDWSYDISNLRACLELLKNYDVVAGVRRRPVHATQPIVRAVLLMTSIFGFKHMSSRSDNFQKAMVSLINYLLIRFLYRVPLSDYQNVVFYETNFIQSLNQEAKSSFANPEYLIKAYWVGKRIIEVPIDFLKRTKGEAKGTKLGAIKASVTDVFKFWWLWRVKGTFKKGHVVPVQRLYESEVGKNKVHPFFLTDEFGIKKNADSTIAETL